MARRVHVLRVLATGAKKERRVGPQVQWDRVGSQLPRGLGRATAVQAYSSSP